MAVAAVGVIGLAGVAACSRGPLQPVEIVPNEDACSLCRMAVSQLQFAAELVTSSGRAEVFDDVGCLAGWLKEHERPEGSAAFVVDYGTGEWIRCEDASYVHSPKVPTPMGYGLLAFGDGARAEAAARALGGTVVGWDQVETQGRP